jgi:hypothetical protein
MSGHTHAEDASPGTQTARLSIHGWVLELRFHGAPGLSSRWCDYTSTHACRGGDVAAEVEVDLVPGWTNSDSREGDEDDTTDRIALSTPVIRGELRRTETGYRGRIQAQGDHIETLDGIVSLLLAILAKENGQIVLHSSAMARDGLAWLFVGPGGAGKTTIAVELNGGRTPLSVDRTLVAFDEDGTAIAHSTPFGDRNRDLPGPGQAKIAGIFFIEQADVHEALPVGPFEATRLIIAQTIAPTRTRETVQKVMDAVGRLVDGVPCHRLRFRKDDGFWPLIDEVLASRT